MQKYKVYINKECKIITENWNKFCSDFQIIHAAGGLVYNPNDQLLCIFRNNVWDLPKGKIDNKENKESAALREINEETGVDKLEIISTLKTTYHVYKYEEKNILKFTHWFKIHTTFNGDLTPQKDEGITQVKWINKKDIGCYFSNSYGNIKDLLKL